MPYHEDLRHRAATALASVYGALSTAMVFLWWVAAAFFVGSYAGALIASPAHQSAMPRKRRRAEGSAFEGAEQGVPGALTTRVPRLPNAVVAEEE